MTIRATWDDEARVWVAESDDVPGLVLEYEKAVRELLSAAGLDFSLGA